MSYLFLNIHFGILNNTHYNKMNNIKDRKVVS